MTVNPRWIGSAAISIALGAVLVAQAPALDVKMGLWEMTSTSTVGGEMPGIDLSKFPPDQAAKMREAMKAAASTPQTTQMCMTKEKFDKGVFMLDDQPGMKCTQTATTNTRSVYESTVTCTGDRAMNGQTRVEALSPSSVKATMKMATVPSGSAATAKPMTVDIAMTAKWIAAACGAVK